MEDTDKKDKTYIKEKKGNGKQNEEINTVSDVVSIYIVLVRVKKKNSSNEVQTYAPLDSCSKGAFMLDKLIKAIGTFGRITSATIKTINGLITHQ